MGTASAAPEHHVLACVLWASVFALVFSQSWPALVLILSVLSVAVFNDQPDLGAPGSSLSATADDGKPPRAPDTPSPLRHPPMAPPPAADPAGLWEVRPSPGRGLGVFACRAIPRGTRVLEEPPLFAVTPPVPPDTAAAAARVTAAFAALPPAGRAAHLACHDGGAPARRPRALRVFRANAFTLPDGRWAMFERHARLNHSCLPNVANAWAAAAGTDGAEGRKVAWALRDIAPGEELLVTYVRLLQTAPARAARLGQYGFRCVCAACAGPDAAAMSVRRAAMGDTLEELEAASTAPEDVLEPWQARECLDRLERLAAMLEADALGDYLARAYRLGAVFARRADLPAQARRWAAALLAVERFVGEDSAAARAAEELLESLG